MLGDSVVAIKHCAIPRGQPRLGARAWFAIAGAAALIGVLSFALTVAVAARNDAARASWLAAHRPAHAFRPEVAGAGYDLAAFAGLGLALAAATLGLVRLRQARLHPLFRIGTAAEVELPVADAPMPSFPLVATREGRLVVRYPRGLSGELVVEQVATPLSELTAQRRARDLGDGSCELRLPQRARMRMRCGSATVLLSVVPRPAQQLPLLAGQFDARLASYGAGALAVHLGILALLRTLPVEATVATIFIDTVEDVSGRTSSTSNDELPEEPEQGAAAGAEAAGATDSAAMALPEGASGDPEAAAASLRLAIKRTSDAQQVSRDQAVAAARESGLIGSTALREANFTALTGVEGAVTSGLDNVYASGAMYGEELGPSFGFHGGGVRGHGPGGGGFEGIIGSGGFYRTIGTVPGGDGLLASATCDGPAPCPPGTLRRGRSQFTPTVRLSEPTCGGETCVDREIIRRYMKRAMEKIRYCYEKELLVDSSLEGTVTASFVISPTGTVLGSRASGVHPQVSSCVAGVVGAIVFPRGAGDAIGVNYPFLFRRPG
jgi:hypothetical protein